jgi:hypothetical protein
MTVGPDDVGWSTAAAAGGQHGIHEARDGRYESEALRSIRKPTKSFRHDVGRGAAHEKPRRLRRGF